MTMHGFSPEAGLAAWLADLRARLDRGDPAMVAPVASGHGTDAVPAEHSSGSCRRTWMATTTGPLPIPWPRALSRA